MTWVRGSRDADTRALPAPPTHCRTASRRAAPAAASSALARCYVRARSSARRCVTQSKSRPSRRRSACRAAAQTSRIDAGMSRGAEDRRAAGAEDPRLLAADGFDVAAQPVAMIERDRRHQRDVGVDHIDGIEPPAHADFEHDGIELAVSKTSKRGQRVELEESERVVAARRVDALERGDQRRRRRLSTPSSSDALVVAKQMRRCERADAIAGLCENARVSATLEPLPLVPPTVMTGTRRTLPVQALERALQALEPQVDRVRMQRLLPREPVSETAEPWGSRSLRPRPCISRPGRRACA